MVYSKLFHFDATLRTNLNVGKYIARLRRRGDLPLKELECEEYYKVKKRIG